MGEGIIVAFVKDMLHQFPAVYVDLDIEREPGFDFDKHEAEFFIQVIVEAYGKRGFEEMASLRADDFCCPASFQGFQDADKAAVNRIRDGKALAISSSYPWRRGGR